MHMGQLFTWWLLVDFFSCQKIIYIESRVYRTLCSVHLISASNLTKYLYMYCQGVTDWVIFMDISIIAARKRSLGQGNIFAPVCHSVHRGEYLTPPWSRHPPGTRYTPWSRHPPHPRDQVHPWEQTPQDQVHPPDQVHPLGSRPPPSRHPPQHRACWEIQSTRGWYASYWNAILFLQKLL